MNIFFKPTMQDRIQWFKDSPDTGDPSCVCSLCGKVIEEGKVPLRLFREEDDTEARFHDDCANEVMQFQEKGYLLPRCFIGQTLDGQNVITEDLCNPKCHCLTPMQAFFCAEGHLTECHAGMNCREAKCSNLERYDDGEDD